MVSLALRKRYDKFHVAQVVVLLLCAGVLAFLYTNAWGLVRDFPYAVEYEGHVFWACAKLSEFANIYDLELLRHQPWCVIIYNPLYFLLGATLFKVTGQEFWPLRMISMCSTLAVFAGILVLVARSKLQEFYASIAVLLFASCYTVIYWSSVARVDMLGLAFAVWGMERFMRGWSRFEEKQPGALAPLAVSLILFLCAFFTKQQYFVFALASTLFCFHQKQLGLGIRYMGTWLISCVVIVLAIQVWTDGGYLAHLSYAAGLPWEWETINRFMFVFVNDRKTIAAMVIILVGTLMSKRRVPFEDLASILFVVSIILVFYTMGLRAAYHNHLLCTQVALFWLAALNLSKLNQWFAALSIAMIALSYGYIMSYFVQLYDRIFLFDETTTSMSILENAGTKDKPVLIEDPSIAMQLNAKPAIVDATTILNMSKKNPEPFKELIAAIEKKQFAAIMIDYWDADYRLEKIWTKPVVETIKMNYRTVGQCGGNGTRQRVYLPLP